MEQPKKSDSVHQKIEQDPNTQHKDHPAQPAPDPGNKKKQSSGDNQPVKGAPAPKSGKGSGKSSD